MSIRPLPRRLRPLSAALTVALVALAAAGSVLAQPARASAASSCVFAAHRGYTAHHPENSMLSFEAAVHQHADYLEMDVQSTKDGWFAIMHDKTIDRTTTGSGRIIDKTWAHLQHATMSDGQHVPSLGAVLAMAKPTGVKVLLELKWVPNSRLERFHKVIEDFGASRVVVNSFSPYVAKRFHQLYPDVASALDVNKAISLSQAKVYGGVMPDYRHVTGTWLSSMKAAGVPVYLWTLDNATLWGRYQGKAALVLTNKAAEYDAWRAKSCA
jgi:glycerophosphoryl diester phosphodiesterase